MLRHVAAALLVAGASTAPARAQSSDPEMTVTVASADVYKSPSTGSPVIGRAPRGARLPVTRELGSWVRVTWPSAPDGVGFVHVTMGRVANGAPPDAVRAAAGEAVKAIPDAERAGTTGGTLLLDRFPRPRRASVTPVPHVVGIGGGLVAGSPVGFSAGARAWRGDLLGVRLDISRQAKGSAAAGRASALLIEPSALVSLDDYISNFFWLRPYVGAGASIRRQSYEYGLVDAGLTTRDTSLGFQAFAGAELTVASAPALALAADFGYRSRRSTFDVFDVGGFGVTMGISWYVR